MIEVLNAGMLARFQNVQFPEAFPVTNVSEAKGQVSQTCDKSDFLSTKYQYNEPFITENVVELSWLRNPLHRTVHNDDEVSRTQTRGPMVL